MRRVPVESTSIGSVGYADNVLEIRFRNGGVYRYFRVPPNVYECLMRAESKGRFFNLHIRNAYRFERLAAASRR
jgi:hypothetical protein